MAFMLHSVDKWVVDTVVDAQPLAGQEEIWHITTTTKPDERKSFYVLGATGEVIGRPEQEAVEDEAPLRRDWSAYIQRRLESPFKLVRWQNGEEYEAGISKAWLNRMEKDSSGVAKVRVAQRYIMANAVGNRYGHHLDAGHSVIKLYF